MKKTVFLISFLFLFLVLPFGSVFADDWVSPTGHELSAWVDEEKAYDELTATWASIAIPANSWSPYIILTIDEITSDKLRTMDSHTGFFAPTGQEIDVFLDGEWINIYNGGYRADTSYFTENYPNEGQVTSMRIKYQAGMFPVTGVYVREVDFWEIGEAPPTEYQLNLNSIPFQNVNFTLNGTTYQTNYTDTLDEGYYNITFPSSWVNNSITYVFKNWSDGLTDPSRIINLNANTTLTVTYILPPKIHIFFVGACVIGGLICFVFILSRRKKR